MFKPLYLVGEYPIQSMFVADTTQRHEYGLTIIAQDPYWGGGTFQYVRATATIPQFGLVALSNDFDSTNKVWRSNATAVPNTANLGSPLGVAMVGLTVGQFGWVMTQGLTPINGTASVAADTAFGITAAGQIGANTAGKQVLSARVQAAATTTVAKAGCTSPSGSLVIQVPDSDGWFIGAYLSGTGVGAAAKVASISPDGRTVTVDVVSTAAINGTVTATYNNATVFYNVARINTPFAQGAIT